MLDVFPVARQALLPLVVVALSFRELGFAVLVVASALFVGYRVLAWSRFSYAVVDGTLRIEHGVLQRHVREVPVTRIQQVDLRRQLRHRVAGVVAVRIDTAGGGSGAEVVLDCLSDAAALALRGELLDPRHRLDAGSLPVAPPAPGAYPGWSPPIPVGPAPTGSPPPASPHPGAPPVDRVPGLPPYAAPLAGAVEGQDLVRLSTRDLVVAGVTGSGLLAGLSIVGFAFLVLDELPDATAAEVGGWVASLFGTLLVVVVAVIVALPFFLVAAAAASVLRDHDFTLVRYGNDLHLKRGLLDQREATLALHRIQAVWVLDNPLRRRLGLVSVQLQSAGGGRDAAGEVATTTIPLLRRQDLAGLLAVVLPGVIVGPRATDGADPEPPPPHVGADLAPAAGPVTGLPVTLVAAPVVARRRSVVRFVVPAALIALAVGLVTWSAAVGLVVLVLASGPAVALGLARYRALAHATTPGTVVARSGAVLHRTALVPVARTQSHRIETSPFQRRLGLASLAIHVAGRGRNVRLVDLHRDRCRAVGDHALGSAEARRDEAAVRRRTLGLLEGSVASGSPR